MEPTYLPSPVWEVALLHRGAWLVKGTPSRFADIIKDSAGGGDVPPGVCALPTLPVYALQEPEVELCLWLLRPACVVDEHQAGRGAAPDLPVVMGRSSSPTVGSHQPGVLGWAFDVLSNPESLWGPAAASTSQAPSFLARAAPGTWDRGKGRKGWGRTRMCTRTSSAGFRHFSWSISSTQGSEGSGSNPQQYRSRRS